MEPGMSEDASATGRVEFNCAVDPEDHIEAMLIDGEIYLTSTSYKQETEVVIALGPEATRKLSNVLLEFAYDDLLKEDPR